MSSELYQKIEGLLQKLPENRPSYYQMKYFVLGKEPTTQARLWRCLRELETKKETMDTLTNDIANQQDQLSLLEIELQDNNTSEKKQKLQKKSHEIKQGMLKRNMESVRKNINKLERQLQFVVQEAKFYIQAFEGLSKCEPLKDYDDLDVQKEYWEAKISEDINLRVLTQQSIGPDLLKTAIAMHDESAVKTEMLKMIDGYSKQMTPKEISQEENDKKAIKRR